MSLTLTYDSALSRVRASMTGLVDAATFRLERSTDQVRWSTVRDAAALVPVAGLAAVDDYEFAADVPNFYRLRGPAAFDNYARSVGAGGVGTATSGQTYTLDGTAADFSVTGAVARVATVTINQIYLATVDVGAPGQVVRVGETLPVVPTGAPFTLRAFARLTNPTNYYQAVLLVQTTGVVTLQLFRNVAGVGASISSAITLPGTHSAGNTWNIDLSAVGTAVAAKAWKTTETEPAAYQVTAVDATLSTGNRAGWGVRRETSNSNGTTNVDFDNLVVETPEATIFTANLTPSLGGVVWVKSIARPFLNRPVIIQDFTAPTRRARAGVFDVVGRSAPIAVNDLRGPKQFNLMVLTESLAAARDFDLVLASGDPLFIHVPAAEAVPGGYVTVGDTGEERTMRRSVRRIFTLPCTVVVPPGPEVVGVTYTWQGVVNDYATWADLLAAFATWADVLDNVGSAEDVVVP